MSAEIQKRSSESAVPTESPCLAAGLSSVTIDGEEWEHVDRLGPGCWHSTRNGRCLSWRGLLDHAWERGVAAEMRRQAETDDYKAGREAAAEDIEGMSYDLGDEGWKALEAKAAAAGWAIEWVRSRRKRDDFTTATIETAYQYGYRRAAEVARGGAS